MASSRALWSLSGFGDEIDDDPSRQVEVLGELDIRWIEVRSAWGVNAIDLSAGRLAEFAGLLGAARMGVSALASPIGKVPYDVDPETELRRLRSAIRVAKALDVPRIRIFSFFVPPDGHAAARERVLRHLEGLAALAARSGIELLHENEKGIYGDTPDRIRDLIDSVAADNLGVAWDPANFVEVGVAPFSDGFDALRRDLRYVQIKDYDRRAQRVVVAGEGDAEIAKTLSALVADGYGGFVSLEPHLEFAGSARGFSGPDGFGRAAAALRMLARDAGAEWA